MKKHMIPYLIIVLVVALGVFFYFRKEPDKKPSENPPTGENNDQNNVDKEKQQKLDKLDNIQKKIDYFNMDYLDRYIAYQEKKPKLSIEDIITQVNIGLDNDYYTNTKETPYLNTNYILSNKYLYMPEDYIPKDLEAINSAYVAKSNMKLVKEAKEQFESLAKAAKNDGYTIRAMSSYRSYDYQVNLYNNYVKQDGKKEADTYSARPGFSEHQTGLVVDVDNAKASYTDFESTKEFNWMQDNAHKYGFILRYPKDKVDITGYTYESWHYRYVGIEIATYIHEHNLTLDEYYVRFIENKK